MRGDERERAQRLRRVDSSIPMSCLITGRPLNVGPRSLPCDRPVRFGNDWASVFGVEAASLNLSVAEVRAIEKVLQDQRLLAATEGFLRNQATPRELSHFADWLASQAEQHSKPKKKTTRILSSDKDKQ